MLLAGISLAAPQAWAGSEGGTLGVTASILDQCAVGDATLALGTIAMVGPSGTMTTVSGGSSVGIPWACTNGTTATLSFGLGGHSTGSDRRMKSTAAGAAGQYVEYQLRAGSAGGAAIGASAVALGSADGTNQAFAVWGGPVDSAANRQAKPAGDYADTVLLTITFSP